MAVSVYYTCIYMHGTSAPFRKEGCHLCYIHIYDVGVGVSLASVLVLTGLLIPQYTGTLLKQSPYANFF